MRVLAERAAFVSMLAVAACSAPRGTPEATGAAALPQLPFLGPLERGWRLPSCGDLNGDGTQDMIWRHHETNRLGVTLMGGTGVIEQGPMMDGPLGDDCIVVTAGSDRNLDGMADIVFHNPTTNVATVWLMHGTQPFVRGPEIPGPPGEGWTCVPCRDFDGDGMSDLLWYNLLTRRMTVWLMRGTEPYARGPEIPGPGEGWIPGFGADLDRDGMADVFWYQPETGRIAVWLMNGTVVRERGPEMTGPPSAAWDLVAAGDFNRDRIADHAWFDRTTGTMQVLLAWRTGILERGREITGPSGDGWIVGNAGDTDGDGMADVMWLNTSPLRASVWLMSGTVPTVRGPEIPGPE